MLFVKYLFLILVLVLCSGCGNFLFVLSRTPALSGLNQRMNARALLRQFNGDPVADVDWQVARGDYRFLGLVDVSFPPEYWLPGVSKGRASRNDATYIAFDRDSAAEPVWKDAAVRYCAIYNRAMLSRRRSKNLNWATIPARPL